MAIRGKAIAVSVGGLVAALIVALVAVFAVIQMKHSADIHKADEAAAYFDKEFNEFESDIGLQLQEQQSSDDADAILSTVDGALDDAPTPPKVPRYGAKNSKAYQAAQKRHESLVEPLGEVKKVAEERKIAAAFVAAAEKLLEVKPSDFLKTTVHRNGDEIRAKMVPGYRKAIHAFDDVEVPQGQEKLAKKVRNAAVYGMKECERVAKRLDKGQGGYIRYGQKVPSARIELTKYESDLSTRLSEAVAAVTGGGTPQV